MMVFILVDRLSTTLEVEKNSHCPLQTILLQPNVENPLSPGAVYSTLPPLPGQVLRKVVSPTI